MKVINELYLRVKNKDKVIYFGIPTIKKELEEMFCLRYEVYKIRGYLNVDRLNSNLLDRDEYDLNGKCYYFIAKIDNKIIGNVRLIKDNTLPTEKCFKFKEPAEIKKIPRDKRGELSRLIVIPYSKKEYLPRHLILFFLINSVIEFSFKNEILGGYSFITKKLYNKLKKLRVPIHTINSYIKIYPKEGILYPYFHQKDNPIIPIYYLRDEVGVFIENIFNKKNIFGKLTKNKFVLKNTLYTRFLRSLKII